jgi:hypothetical protein
MKETFYIGAHGNLSLYVAKVMLSGMASAGVKVLAEGLPIGTEIVGIRHITDNLGAGTGIKVELIDASASTTELLSVTTTAADSGVKVLSPVYISDDGPSDLVLTNTGSEATGEVVIQLEYRFKGY